jgi:hypothetical protein
MEQDLSPIEKTKLKCTHHRGKPTLFTARSSLFDWRQILFHLEQNLSDEQMAGLLLNEALQTHL